MKRYHLVIGGTAAGIAGVLAFPTQHTKLSIPSASAATTSPTTGATSSTSSPSSPSSTSPAAAGSGGSSATTKAPSTTKAPPTTSATQSATSDDVQFRFGDLSVKVTVQGTKITNVGVASINETDGRSQMIDQYAVPQLEQQVISAGSVNINGVSGATYTSQAFVDAVANALQKMGISS
jgi:uncharacterized protein with FMN-binding domain